MRSFVAGCCVIGATLLAGCGGADDEPTSRGEEKPADCSAHGSLTDLSAEPKYSANYLHRWTMADGCPVRLDVLMKRDYCGGGGVEQVLMGWPLGQSHANHRPYRTYVGDPQHVLDGPAGQAFDDDAELPADAVDTGYRQGDGALWMRPNDDSFIYLVTSERVEAWPYDESLPGCL